VCLALRESRLDHSVQPPLRVADRSADAARSIRVVHIVDPVAQGLCHLLNAPASDPRAIRRQYVEIRKDPRFQALVTRFGFMPEGNMVRRMAASCAAATSFATEGAPHPEGACVALCPLTQSGMIAPVIVQGPLGVPNRPWMRRLCCGSFQERLGANLGRRSEGNPLPQDQLLAPNSFAYSQGDSAAATSVASGVARRPVSCSMLTR